MAASVVASVALPISNNFSFAPSMDVYGKLSDYGRISTDIDAAIMALFANNEVGAFFDPSDLSTMFQDSAGTTPVTADGQPVGLILDKSKGLVFPEGAPAGFGAVPFGVTVNNDGTTDFDPTDYRLVEGASGVTTYYIDKATGLDTNAGTSVSPFKTLNKLAFIPNATAPNILAKVKGGTYYLTENLNGGSPQATKLSVVSWDGLPIICSNENPSITPASWTLDTSNTYWAPVSGYGYSHYGSSVWDAKVLDASGDYKPLVPVASIAACNATANTYFTDSTTSRVYAHLSDNRVPDSFVHVFEAWGSPGQFINYGSIPVNTQCYFEDTQFKGGNNAFVIQQKDAALLTVGVFNRCSFKYTTSNNCVQVSGNIEIALDTCLVAQSHADGFSYHSYGSSAAPRAIEIDCEARYCGSILTGTANQGSTMHDGGKIVRVNGNYHHNENDQIADVLAGTKSWLVKCNIHDGLKAGYSGVLSGNGTGTSSIWLYSCIISGCTKDIAVSASSILYDKDYLTRSVVSNSGTVINYSATGTLGNHASQATAAARPLYKTDGTYHWLQFDGVDDSLSTAAIDFTSTDKMSVFGGVNKVGTLTGIITELSASADSEIGSFAFYGNNTDYYLYPKGTNGNNGKRVFTFTSPVKNVIAFELDMSLVGAGAGAKTYKVNGTVPSYGSVGTTNLAAGGNFGTWPIYIGRRGATAYPFNGNIYSIIIRGALSTTQEITDTETWVAAKTGVTL